MSEFRTRSLITRSVVLLVALLFAVPFATAQVTTGSVQGFVKDPAGAVVAGAAVKVTNTATGIVRETTTNDEGFYRVTNLLPGDAYQVEVTAAGFAVSTNDGIGVRLGLENDVSIQLSLTSATGEVTVTGETPLIQSTQSQLSTAYSSKQLTQLPFNGGSIDNLALLTPGVVTPGDTDFTNGVGISANGNRGRSNNFQIDGQDNNDNSVAGPSLGLDNTEAIGEYQVITNSASAEFGRNSGAQINTITKSGTNEFHGALFYYIQGSALNTRDNLDKKAQSNYKFLSDGGFTAFSGFAARTKDPFMSHRLGGAIGGPIVKNKAFFFATYQADRTRGEATTDNFTTGQVTFTPASAALAHAILNTATTAALTSTAVAGGPAFAQGVGQFIVGPPLLDTDGNGVADAFVYGPATGFLSDGLYIRNPGTGLVVPLFFGESARLVRTDSAGDQFIGRVDWNATSKDTIVGRYIYDNDRFPLATGRFLAGAIFDVPSQNNNLGITYTRTISSSMVNEARFNFSRLFVTFGDTSTKPGAGIQFSGNRNLNLDLSLTFGTQNNLPQSRRVDVYQYQDTLSTTVGNHSLRMGVDIRQQKVNNFFLPNYLGTYTFAGSTYACASASAVSGSVPNDGAANPIFFFNPAGSADNCTGGPDLFGPRTGRRATAYENFLLNRPRQINFAKGNPATNTNQNDYFFFFQDDWRIRPNLTLNLGVRYEISTTPFNPLIEASNAREADASTAIFDPAFPLATRTVAKLPLDKNNFAPRVGFAWQPNIGWLGDRFSNGRTVIRGGFSIAYDPSFFNIVLNTVTAAPFAAAGIVIQNPNTVATPGNPLPGTGLAFPFLPTTTAQLNTTPGTAGGDPRLFNQTRVSPDFYNPYTIGWNFGFQQEVFKNSVFEGRYVGSRIIGQFQTINGNPDLKHLARAGCDPILFPGANPATCGGRFTGGIIAPGATLLNTFDNRPGTNGSGRQDPAFGPTRTRINGATSTYHGAQFRFDTRFFTSFALNANYTLSKTIDNASEIFSTFGGGQGVAHSQDVFNRNSGERGLSAFHQKHNFTTNFIWELPWFKEQRGAKGKFLGGYQISSIIRMGSGRAFSPINAFATYDPSWENAFIGAGSLRPFTGNPNAPVGTIAFGYAAACLLLFGGPECDYNGGTAAAGDFIIYNTLNPGALGTVVTGAPAAIAAANLIYNDFGGSNQFGVPLSDLEAFAFFRTPFGNTGRNTYSGFPFYGVNFSVFKTTNLTERTKLEFRLEAANLLNRRNYGVPDPFTEDAHNGFAVSSFMNPGFNNGSQRELRFGLRFIF